MDLEQILSDPSTPVMLRALADALEMMNGAGQGAPAEGQGAGAQGPVDLNAMAAAPAEGGQ